MDSLTQITLGAACGELVLGKKIGNRAMLWGAIGGTIPDLDVMANFFISEMDALAFHRAISHSIFFAVTTPFLFGWLTHRFYDSGWYQRKGYKSTMAIIWLLLLAGLLVGVNYAAASFADHLHYPTLFATVAVFVIGIYNLRQYVILPLDAVAASQKEWILLFFWSIFTHPLLDAFTAYGTQLFAPFSSYRVAFNTISVVDPIYTVPFLLCLIIASYLKRTAPIRRYLTYAGLVWSSSYLLFTVFNKQHIDKVFEASLVEQGIDFKRFRTSPSIFNNILWQGVAETDSTFYMGTYSLFDKTSNITFYPLAKQHELLAPYTSDKVVRILTWFSDGYYNVMPLEGDKLQVNDIRYGSMAEASFDPKDFVFRFELTPTPKGLEAHQKRDVERTGAAFGDLYKRVLGK